MKKLIVLVFGLIICQFCLFATSTDSIKTENYILKISGLTNQIKSSYIIKTPQQNVEIIDLEFEAMQPIKFPKISIEWTMPANNIQGLWSTGSKGLRPDWGSRVLTSRATTNSPVICLHSYNNDNVLTFALSDALNAIVLHSGVVEETAQIINKIQLFTDPQPQIKKYTLQILLDKRPVKYWQSLNDVSTWWASFPRYKPATVPLASTLPMYSSWYSFHQNLTADGLLKQCKLAQKLGCKTLLIDDGWQTLDNNRGYKHCGDWQPQRLPEMKKLVDDIHQLGMKVGVWYSVPYIGKYSNTYSKLKNQFLFVTKKDSSVGTLDPRFPEVRRYLIDTYKNALINWGIDGFKLDFVDNFILIKSDDWVQSLNYSEEATDGRDYASVYEAVDRLMSDVMLELKAINPDIMIEFRQSYIGPLMRKYGNMFRAGDCPYNAVQNRRSIVDLRLLSGTTATHADPQMWNIAETPEVAALQLLNTIFAVPQISVKLDEIPLSHYNMLSFWLNFYSKHTDVLLNGNIKPYNPELSYPIIQSVTLAKNVVAVYLPNMIINMQLEERRRQNFIVNATHSKTVNVNFGMDHVQVNIKTYTCTGELTQNKMLRTNGIVTISIPASGLAEITDIQVKGEK